MTAPSTVAAAMQHAIDTLRELSQSQLEDIALGRGRLVFAPDDGPAGDPPVVPGSPVTAQSAAAPPVTEPAAPPSETAWPHGTGSAPRRRAPHATARRSPARPSARAATAPGPEVTAAVEAIRRLATPAEVEGYLREHDRRLTTPLLKEIARALGPTVSSSARSKADLQRDIVAGTAGFRARSAAMSGGAWS